LTFLIPSWYQLVNFFRQPLTSSLCNIKSNGRKKCYPQGPVTHCWRSGKIQDRTVSGTQNTYIRTKRTARQRMAPLRGSAENVGCFSRNLAEPPGKRYPFIFQSGEHCLLQVR